jgi:hypothetical protein
MVNEGKFWFGDRSKIAAMKHIVVTKRKKLATTHSFLGLCRQSFSFGTKISAIAAPTLAVFSTHNVFRHKERYFATTVIRLFAVALYIIYGKETPSPLETI